MPPTRNSVIRQALEASQNPLSHVRFHKGMKPLDAAAHLIRSAPVGSEKMGAYNKILRVLPKADQDMVRGLYRDISDERDRGRHGDVAGYLSGRGVPDKRDQALVNRVVDGLQTERLTYDLGQRMGVDKGRELPELTRADVISAAIDSHTTKD